MISLRLLKKNCKATNNNYKQQLLLTLMDQKTVTALFEEMRDDIALYAKSSVELAKLEAFEKLSKAAAQTTVTTVTIKLIALFLAMLFITIGFLLGHLLESLWLGFALSTTGALLLLLIFLLLRNRVKNNITNKSIRFLMRNDDDKLSFKSK